MVFRFHNNFTSKTAYKIWSIVSKIDDGIGIIIDLTHLKYVDAEGTNYIILFPYLFKSKFQKIQIILPQSDMNVYQFLNDCGVFDILKKDFIVIEQGVLDLFPNQFSYNKKQSKNNKYIPLFKSFVFDTKEQTNIFSTLSDNYDTFKWNIGLSTRATKCLTELIFNVYDHSEQDFCCITLNFMNVGKEKIPYLFICVSDLGIGIKNSFLKSSRFSKSVYKRKGDNYYIAAAVTKGVSSLDLQNRGFGLSVVLHNSNKLLISTGNCRSSFTKHDDDYTAIKEYKTNRVKRMIGTSIVALIKGYEI